MRDTIIVDYLHVIDCCNEEAIFESSHCQSIREMKMMRCGKLMRVSIGPIMRLFGTFLINTDISCYLNTQKIPFPHSIIEKGSNRFMANGKEVN